MHSLARFHGTLCMPSSLAVPSFWSGTPALQLATRPIVSLQLPQRLCRGTGWHFCQEQLFTLLSFQKWLDFKRKNNVLIFRWPNERKWWHGSLESLNNRCIERECTSGRGEKTHLSTKTGATSRCFTSRLLSPLFFIPGDSLCQSHLTEAPSEGNFIASLFPETKSWFLSMHSKASQSSAYHLVFCSTLSFTC